MAETEGHIARPPSRRRLLVLTGGGFLVASLIVVLAVLPAELHIDPTGFGALTGLSKLSAPKEVQVKLPAEAVGPSSVARYYPAPFRSDTVDIPLAAGGDPNRGDELEYKVRMKTGDSLVYAWTTTAKPEEFYYDFHGETPAGPGQPEAKVVEYKQVEGAASNGVLIAPIDGVHGWFLQNQSEKPVVVHLKLSGFYDLVPPGEYGNEARVVANKPIAAK